jgi:hypothetical protein
MQRKRAALQHDLFSNTPTRTAHRLPPAIHAEVLQLLETLLREVVQAQLRPSASLEAGDEQDQR